jgi:hypothetical protein
MYRARFTLMSLAGFDLSESDAVAFGLALRGMPQLLELSVDCK